MQPNHRRHRLLKQGGFVPGIEGTPSDGDFLYYDADSGKWKATGGGFIYNDDGSGIVGLGGTSPEYYLLENDRGTDLKRWRWHAAASIMSLQTRTDANGAGSDILVATRGATTALTDVTLGPSGNQVGVNVTANLFEVRDGQGLRVQDSANTDYVEISHDGTDINYAHVNTTDMNIRDGVVVKIHDSTDADTFELSHDGTDAIINVSSGNIEIREAGVVFIETADEAVYGVGALVRCGGGNGDRPVKTSRNRTSKTNGASAHSYTMAATDFSAIIEKQGSGTFTLTLPLNATTAIENGFETYLHWLSTGTNLTLTAATGVTMRVRFGGALTTTTSGSQAITTLYNGALLRIWKRNTDDWVVTEVSN